MREASYVKRLSVAVLVDGTYGAPDADGKRPYAALPDETMQNIDKLVKSSIGFDGKRGDDVQVVNMPFTNMDDLMGNDKPFNLLGFTKEEIMRIAEGLGVAVVAVLVILLVVRPLVTRAFEAMPQGEEGLLSTGEGRVKASSLRKIGDIVDKHPEEALSIIRTWLYQEA